MSTLADMLRNQITALEAQLKRGNPHECRFCMWFDCGKTDSCKCGCNQIGKERALHLEGLRALADCIDTGEIPQGDSEDEHVPT